MPKKYDKLGVPVEHGFDVRSGLPIDTRLVVTKVSDLTSPGTWGPGDLGNAYLGMTVTVLETGDLWVLTKSPVTEPDSWQPVGGNADQVSGDNVSVRIIQKAGRLTLVKVTEKTAEVSPETGDITSPGIVTDTGLKKALEYTKKLNENLETRVSGWREY